MSNLSLKVTELHEQGFSYNQIAHELGISKSKAYRIINETVNVSDDETNSERFVSETFQNVPKDETETKHFETKQTNYHNETRNNVETDENFIVKTQLDGLKKDIAKLKGVIARIREKHFEYDAKILHDTIFDLRSGIDSWSEEDHATDKGLGYELRDKIKDFFWEASCEKGYDEEGIRKLILKTEKLQAKLNDRAEEDETNAGDLRSFKILKKMKKTMINFLENFELHSSFFEHIVYLTFDEKLLKKIEEYR